ncbi:hypothetical protein MMC29_004397 [Sticta canariensis]|nr:hypothetical protein [Sticta canariensis]
MVNTVVTDTVKSNLTSTITSILQISRNRADSLHPDEYSIAILDGYTFTSPSLYLQIVGTARVINDCGQVGSVYTDAIVAVPDGDLSTISLDLSIGASFQDANRINIPAHTKPLRVADLACPTWGLEDSPHRNDLYGYTTVGYPFNPIIVPPSQLISLDSAWLQCTSYPRVAWVGAGGICKSLRNEVFDPPRQLTPVSALLPAATTASITSASYQKLPSTSPAEPAGIGSPRLPANTNKPPQMTLDPSTSKGSEHVFSASPEASPSLGKDRTTKADKISIEDPKNQPVKSATRDPESYPAEDPSPDTRRPPAGFDRNNPEQHQDTPGTYEERLPDVNPLSGPNVEDNGSNHQTLGQTIYNMFNGIHNAPNRIFNHQAATITLPTSTSAVTAVAGLMVTVIDPSIVALAGTVISAGGNPATISGMAFSLLSSNRIVAQVKPDISHVVALPMSTSTKVTVADRLVTIINPSAIAIAGTMLSVGGDAKTISNTVFSLDSAGGLFVDPIGIDSHTPATITVAGQLVTIISPSAIAIAGTTLSIGGSSKTISNTVFSLDSAGGLVVDPIGIDSHIFALPTTTSATITVAGQLVTIIGPSVIAIAGTTLSIGGSAKTVSNTVFSLDSAGGLVVDPIGIDSHTFALPTATSATITVAGHLITVVNPSTILIAGNTLSINGDAKVLSNTAFSLDSAGDLVVESINVDSHTFGLPSIASATVSAAGQLITVINPSMVRVASVTLSAGGKAITLSGTVMSLAPSNKLVIKSSGTSIKGTTVSLSPTISSVFTIAGLTFTPISRSGVVVDGQTILPGAPAISLLNRHISLDSNGNLIVNDGPTKPQPFSVFPIDRLELPTATASTTNIVDKSSVNIWPTRTSPGGSYNSTSPSTRKAGEPDPFLGAQDKLRIPGIKILTGLAMIRMILEIVF